MKYLLPLLLLVPACVTPGEFARLAQGVDAVRLAVEDRDTPMAEIGARLDDLADDVQEVAADVDARTAGMISAGEAAGGGSLLLTLGLVALNRLRDRKRRMRGEPVSEPTT